MKSGSKLVKTIGIILIVLIISGYAIYQTYNLVAGPVLSVSYPASGMTYTEPLVEIKGFVKNASHITLNDNPIFVNEEGTFSEKLLLSYGYNIFEIEINDKFERTKREKIELIYNPNENL
ncbi:hypothetical protein KKC45_00070 [Patescibacteria group bacterium]|nr:hypothetical protein [Patescibacteria group bacterium]